MTNRVTRYTQPVVQTTPGLDFKVEEVELFEDPKGKWVRYDDIKHLLPDEPPSKSDAEFLSLVGHCSNCSCQDCREFFKADARARVEPSGYRCQIDGPHFYECKHCHIGVPIGEPPADRKSALDEIVRISEEAGLYDEPEVTQKIGLVVAKGVFTDAQIEQLDARGLSIIEQECSAEAKYEMHIARGEFQFREPGVYSTKHSGTCAMMNISGVSCDCGAENRGEES